MEEISYKDILTVISIILIIVGYIPYVRDILRGKTHPHVFSWIIWSTLNFCLFGLQLDAGGGFASWIVLVLGLNSAFITILGYKYGKRDIQKIDIFCFITALLAIPLWLVLGQAIISAILVTGIGILAFAPTVRKTWVDPYSETVVTYNITTLRHVLTLFALSQYNIITMIFPAIWVCINLSFLAMIWYRRKYIKRPHAVF